jgi:hypothetical protein
MFAPRRGDSRDGMVAYPSVEQHVDYMIEAGIEPAL